MKVSVKEERPGDGDADELGEAECEGLILGLVDDEGDKLADAEDEGETELEGEIEALGEMLGLVPELGETLGLTLELGDTDDDGETLALGEEEVEELGLTLGLALTAVISNSIAWEQNWVDCAAAKAIELDVNPEARKAVSSATVSLEKLVS